MSKGMVGGPKARDHSRLNPKGTNYHYLTHQQIYFVCPSFETGLVFSKRFRRS